MSRIYDALQRVEETVGKNQPQPSLPEELAADLPSPSFTLTQEASAVATMPEKHAASAVATAPALTPIRSDESKMASARMETPWSVDRARVTPWQADQNRLTLFGNDREHRLASEQFRTLRSRMYQMRSAEPLKIILVTSASPTEGKSFVAANLAHAFSRQTGRRCLLIDGDLRRSTLSYYFGAPQTPGITEFMRGQATTDQVIQQGNLKNLYFAAAGSPSPDPSEMVSSPKLREWVTGLAPLFDWIVIDSPPAVAVSDASRLAEIADGVLLVVRASYTRWEQAQQLRDEFKLMRVLGVVMNNYETPSYYSYNYCYSAADEGLEEALVTEPGR